MGFREKYEGQEVFTYRHCEGGVCTPDVVYRLPTKYSQMQEFDDIQKAPSGLTQRSMSHFSWTMSRTPINYAGFRSPAYGGGPVSFQAWPVLESPPAPIRLPEAYIWPSPFPPVPDHRDRAANLVIEIAELTEIPDLFSPRKWPKGVDEGYLYYQFGLKPTGELPGRIVGLQEKIRRDWQAAKARNRTGKCKVTRSHQDTFNLRYRDGVGYDIRMSGTVRTWESWVVYGTQTGAFPAGRDFKVDDDIPLSFILDSIGVVPDASDVWALTPNSYIADWFLPIKDAIKRNLDFPNLFGKFVPRYAKGWRMVKYEYDFDVSIGWSTLPAFQAEFMGRKVASGRCRMFSRTGVIAYPEQHRDSASGLDLGKGLTLGALGTAGSRRK